MCVYVFMCPCVRTACPPGWTFRSDARGRAYFRYAPVKKTTWQDPRFLPDGWEQRIDDNGQVYYAFRPTSMTTWTDPRGLPTPWTAVLEPSQTEITFCLNGLTTNIDPRGLPHGFSQLVDPRQPHRVYFQNDITKTTSYKDPRDSMSVSQRTEALSSQRSHYMAEQLQAAVEANRTSDEYNASGTTGQLVLDVERQFDQLIADIDSDRDSWLESRNRDWEIAEQQFARSLERDASRLSTKHAQQRQEFEERIRHERAAMEARLSQEIENNIERATNARSEWQAMFEKEKNTVCCVCFLSPPPPPPPRMQ
jgi:hypothetical protein